MCACGDLHVCVWRSAWVRVAISMGACGDQHRCVWRSASVRVAISMGACGDQHAFRMRVCTCMCVCMHKHNRKRVHTGKYDGPDLTQFLNMELRASLAGAIGDVKTLQARLATLRQEAANAEASCRSGIDLGCACLRFTTNPTH